MTLKTLDSKKAEKQQVQTDTKQARMWLRRDWMEDLYLYSRDDLPWTILQSVKSVVGRVKTGKEPVVCVMVS